MSSGVNQRIVWGQNNWKVVAPPFHVNATRISNGHFFLATKPLTPRIHHFCFLFFALREICSLNKPFLAYLGPNTYACTPTVKPTLYVLNTTLQCQNEALNGDDHFVGAGNVVQ